MADKKTILIIDDDATFRELVNDKLTASGFNVYQAPNGREGIKKISELHPDLVLLDVQMPEMDGMQTIASIMGNPDLSNEKVLFLTNLGDASPNGDVVDDNTARELGAAGHIKKSEDLDKIVKKIRLVMQ